MRLRIVLALTLCWALAGTKTANKPKSNKSGPLLVNANCKGTPLVVLTNKLCRLAQRAKEKATSGDAKGVNEDEVYSPRYKLSKRMLEGTKRSSTVPVGPLRCLARISSAMFFLSSGIACRSSGVL